MKLPKWLDRELRIREASKLAKAKSEEMSYWFNRCTDLRLEIAGLKRQIASKDQRIAEAVHEAERLRAELDKYERATP